MFGIYGTVERRLRDEFRSYGANIAAVPVSGKTVPLEIAAAAEKLGADGCAVPDHVRQAVGTEVVPVAGFVPAKTARDDARTGTCRAAGTSGRANASPASCSLQDAAAVGSSDRVSAAPCTVKGIVSTGGAEDQELLVPFETAATLAGIHDAASLIEIRAPGEQVETVRAALGAAVPRGGRADQSGGRGNRVERRDSRSARRCFC